MTLKQRRLTVGAAAAMAMTFIALTFVGTSSTADVTTQYFATTSRASDPFIFRCPGTNGIVGYCMVTSQDLADKPINPGGSGENFYPMSKTLGFKSDDGVKWSAATTAVTEKEIGREGFRHLWAPAARWVYNPTNRGPANEFYLYTPDLTNKDNKNSSRIFVTYSESPTSGYGAKNIPGTNVKYTEIQNAPSGYMSDPEVFVDDSAYNTTDTAKQYLLWANGDYATCGDLSIGKMDSHIKLKTTTASAAKLVIRGLENGNAIDGNNSNNHLDQGLGNCTTSSGTLIRNPYIEGGSLFRTANWESRRHHSLPGPYVLVFSAKPSVTPGVCKQPGQPNKPNEVIAYATSSSVTGPYDYQGIIQCGSSSEWTDQATIAEVKGADGNWYLMLVYHDGVEAPNKETPRQRKLHSECLFVHNGKFLLTSRSPEGAVNASGTRQWCLKQQDAGFSALKSARTGKYVISRTNQQLEATSPAIGLWEQFADINNRGGSFLLARNPGNLYVQVNRNAAGKPVIARGSAPGTWEKLNWESVSGQTRTYRLKDDQGYYWRVDSAGKISAATTNPSASDNSYWFIQEWIW